MKKIILMVVMAVLVVPTLVSAQRITEVNTPNGFVVVNEPVTLTQGEAVNNWRTIAGHVSFTNDTQRLVITSDGVEVLTLSPKILVQSVGGGEGNRLVTELEFDFTFDLNVYDGEHTLKASVI